jgi:NAD(P)-dependent dehydrogenase (short-subunit alcohol dehydrogenase family)/uncharacterized protein (DUF952 family)
MPLILHIAPRTEWLRAIPAGEYRHESLASEGFIHCSMPEQLAWVAKTFFAGVSDLVVLRIDSERLRSPLRWETPPGMSEAFPHIYGPLNPSAVLDVIPLEQALGPPGSNAGPDLRGQVAVVTGGSRGIGRAIAFALARAGASVAVVARTEGPLVETVEMLRGAGGRALLGVSADVSDPGAFDRVLREVETQLGPVKLLVNCVGVVGPIGPLWECDPNAWWRSVEINLRGPMNCCAAALPGMLARGKGRIVNVASGAGTQAFAHLSAYVVAKTALIRYTENLAAEAGPGGVTAFAIEPGTVRTAMAEEALESEAGKKWMPWFRSIFDEGRDVSAEHAAQLVIALASGQADLLSGRFLTIADDLVRLTELARQGNLSDLQLLRLRT